MLPFKWDKSAGFAYKTDNAWTFTIRYQIYDTIPETYVWYISKKMPCNYERYNVNGISHYIMKNNETHSVAWTNGNIEVHIQGNLVSTMTWKRWSILFIEE
ncbi:DUF4367 domain-containing protein [Dysosmobacter welbionis]|uniref:DUF4367 domain-containing protein n=1 Tax=Dysosmobacter welbionis TaxID=2093857 RepID=UPI00338DC0A4